jgi:hypothetical protein
MVADRYAGETTWTKRIVREHYDQPVPKTGRGITDGAGGNGSGADARASEARLAARAKVSTKG